MSLLIQLPVAILCFLAFFSLCKLRQINAAILFFYIIASIQVLLRISQKVIYLVDDNIITDFGKIPGPGSYAFGLFLTLCLTQILITVHLLLVVIAY